MATYHIRTYTHMQTKITMAGMMSQGVFTFHLERPGHGEHTNKYETEAERAEHIKMANLFQLASVEAIRPN